MFCENILVEILQFVDSPSFVVRQKFSLLIKQNGLIEARKHAENNSQEQICVLRMLDITEKKG